MTTRIARVVELCAPSGPGPPGSETITPLTDPNHRTRAVALSRRAPGAMTPLPRLLPAIFAGRKDPAHAPGRRLGNPTTRPAPKRGETDRHP